MSFSNPEIIFSWSMAILIAPLLAKTFYSVMILASEFSRFTSIKKFNTVFILFL